MCHLRYSCDNSLCEKTRGIPFVPTFKLWKPGQTSRYSDQAVGWEIRGSNPGIGNKFFCPPNRPVSGTQTDSYTKGNEVLSQGKSARE
jgi:hypothetical protein